jgi:hypothetical protein
MNSTRRTLALIGAPVLMLGFFLPVLSLFGLLNFSYFDLLRLSARFATGLIILALGGLSLFLALKNNFKPLIATGVLALAVLAFDFITYKKALAGLSPAGRIESGAGGGTGPQLGEFVNELASVAIQPSWGMFFMAGAAILLIVAGTMKDKTPVSSTDWNRNPPPPMNYS